MTQAQNMAVASSQVNGSGVLTAPGGGTGLAAPGASGQVLTSNGTAWVSQAPAGGGVASIAGGTTGITPAAATTGAVTLGGTLVAANGGTGLTSPGASGNVLTSDGTTWTSAAPTSGVPAFGAVGTSVWGSIFGNSSAAAQFITAGASYAAGSGFSQVQLSLYNATTDTFSSQPDLSGSWRYQGYSTQIGGFGVTNVITALFVRVA